MDKLLDSGVDINLLDRVSYVLMISISLSYLTNPIWEGRVNYASVADTYRMASPLFTRQS